MILRQQCTVWWWCWLSVPNKAASKPRWVRAASSFVLIGCFNLTFLIEFYKKKKKKIISAHFWYVLVVHKPCGLQWFIRIYIAALSKVLSPLSEAGQQQLWTSVCCQSTRAKPCPSWQHCSPGNQGCAKESIIVSIPVRGAQCRSVFLLLTLLLIATLPNLLKPTCAHKCWWFIGAISQSRNQCRS